MGRLNFECAPNMDGQHMWISSCQPRASGLFWYLLISSGAALQKQFLKLLSKIVPPKSVSKLKKKLVVYYSWVNINRCGGVTAPFHPEM